MMIGLGVAFVVWSALFIALGSWQDPSGRRYFVLFDDAFISLRYAANAAQGLGLVWNPGERVEGYTNLLMTLLMIVPSWLFDRSHAALAVQVFGVVTVLGAALLAFRLAQRLGVASAWAAFAAVLTCYPLAYWSLLGMETGLLAVLFLMATGAALDPPARPDPRVPLLLGLALATRPDALASAVVVLGFRAWHADARGRRATAIEAGLVPGLRPRAHRLPVDVLRKPAAQHLRAQDGGAAASPPPAHGDADRAAHVGLAAAGARAGGGGAAEGKPTVAFSSWPPSGSSRCWPTCTWAATPGPAGASSCPALPPLFVLAAQGAGLLAARARPVVARARRPRRRPGPGQRSLRPRGVLARYPYLVEYVGWYVRIGVTLQRICTPEATVGVFGAGAVPYYSGLYGIDFYGKSDQRVARRPPDLRFPIGHNKTDLAYSIGQRRPDYVEGFSWGSDDARFALPDYEKIGDLYIRRDVPPRQVGPRPARPLMRAEVAVAVLSALILFLEMLLVRWVGTELRIFAYLQNGVLVATFLGLGLGCWRSRQPPRLLPAAAALALVALAIVDPFGWQVGETLTQGLTAFQDSPVWFTRAEPQQHVRTALVFFSVAVTFALLAALAAVFVPSGNGWAGGWTPTRGRSGPTRRTSRAA